MIEDAFHIGKAFLQPDILKMGFDLLCADPGRAEHRAQITIEIMRRTAVDH